MLQQSSWAITHVRVVETVGKEMHDQGHSCKEHTNNCGEVMAKDVVVCLCKVQIMVEGWEKMAIAAYWMMDQINCCHVGFLPCHIVRHATRYERAVAQSPMFLVRILPAVTPRSAACFIIIKGVAWRQ
jgi:hypothetical protein